MLHEKTATIGLLLIQLSLIMPGKIIIFVCLFSCYPQLYDRQNKLKTDGGNSYRGGEGGNYNKANTTADTST